MAFHADCVGSGTQLAGRVSTSVEVTGPTALLCATESLDLGGATRLQARAASVILNCRWLILDLHSADFVDSDGVRVILELARALQAKGSELVLVAPAGSRIERTLHLLRLQDRIRIFERLDEAWRVQPLASGKGH